MTIKSVLKNFIKLTGYEIVNKKAGLVLTTQDSFSQKTMGRSLMHLRSLNYAADVIVDVGAGSGTEPLLTAFPQAEFILVEPLIEFLPGLEQLKEKFNIRKIIIAAAGTIAMDITLNVHPDLYGSSLLNENEGPYADGTPRIISMMKLKDEIIHLNPAKHNILKVDVQGSELDVLQSAEDLLNVFDVIILEVSFFNFLKNAPDFASVIKYMDDKNYVVYDMFDFHTRPLDNALAQADILFVKRDGQFRTTHNYADAETRKKLNLL
ncbi:MAG: FkbM family methyltransferase [Ferruginibacter sp.]|nr:FkbM family methyltransferase [Ferruginibacter sp.]